MGHWNLSLSQRQIHLRQSSFSSSLTAHNRILNDGTSTYTYDAEGNRTSKTDIATGSKVEYQWNHANLLTGVICKTSNNVVTKSVAYQYDALGRRIGKSVDDNGNGTVDRRESYIYDGAGLLATGERQGVNSPSASSAIHISGPNGSLGQHGWTDQMVLSFVDADGDGSGTAQLSGRYLYGPAVDEIFAVENGTGDVLWSLTDQLGTPRDWAQRTSSGNTIIAQHLRYTAFGAIDSIVDSNNSPLTASVSPLATFTGQLNDSDSGLIYYRARWYDAQLGKFISDDPMGFEAGDANVSRYAGNNTQNTADPTGMADWVWPWDPNASWNPVDTGSTWVDMTSDLVLTGDISAPIDVSEAAAVAFVDELPRPSVTASGVFTVPLPLPYVPPGTIQGGPTGGGELVWNWVDLTFDEYTYVGGSVSVGAGPPISASGTLGIGLVFNLPSSQPPQAYEGPFHTVGGTYNPGGIGASGGIAVSDGLFDAPWSPGAGINFGTPGASANYSYTVYTYEGQTW